MAKDKRSRDQKRKAKLKQRRDRSQQQGITPYAGSKYHKTAYVGLWQSAEIGIYEAHMICDRSLTDDDVVSGLESLIRKLRVNSFESLIAPESFDASSNGDENLVVWGVLRNWQSSSETGKPFNRDARIGVLRSILSSIKIHRSQGLASRSFLNYLGKFLKKQGLSFEVYSDEEFAELQREEETALLTE